MCQICQDNVLKTVEEKQDIIQKMLREDHDRCRQSGKDVQAAVKEHRGKQEDLQDQKEAPKETKTTKLFPNSPLFKEWGGGLSEEEQREAQTLFQSYGYNVFLSDRLPLDRALPDTREPR